MTDLRFWPVVALAAVAVLVAGCTSTDTTGGGYSPKGSRGGGWENFRAETPLEPMPSQVA